MVMMVASSMLLQANDILYIREYFSILTQVKFENSRSDRDTN